MVDNLINKTLAWEDEKKVSFLYDGVSCLFLVQIILYRYSLQYFSPKFISSYCLQVRLVSILQDYKLARQQREEEKKRCRVNNKRFKLC